MDGAFGLLEGGVVFPKCYTRANEENSQLLHRTLSESPETKRSKRLTTMVEQSGENSKRQLEARSFTYGMKPPCTTWFGYRPLINSFITGNAQAAMS